MYLIRRGKASRAEIRKAFTLADSTVGEHLNNLIRKGLIFRGNHGVYCACKGFEMLKNTFNELLAEGEHLQSRGKGFKYEYIRKLMQTPYYKHYIKSEDFKIKLFLNTIQNFVKVLPTALESDKFQEHFAQDFKQILSNMQNTQLSTLPFNPDAKQMLVKQQGTINSKLIKLKKIKNIKTIKKKSDESDEDFEMRQVALSSLKTQLNSGVDIGSALAKLEQELMLRAVQRGQFKAFSSSSVDKIYKDAIKNTDKKARISKRNLLMLSRSVIRQKEEKPTEIFLLSSPSALDMLINVDNNLMFLTGFLEYYLSPFIGNLPKMINTFNKLPKLKKVKKSSRSQFCKIVESITKSVPGQPPLYKALEANFVIDANKGELILTPEARRLVKNRFLPQIKNPEER